MTSRRNIKRPSQNRRKPKARSKNGRAAFFGTVLIALVVTMLIIGLGNKKKNARRMFNLKKYNIDSAVKQDEEIYTKGLNHEKPNAVKRYTKNGEKSNLNNREKSHGVNLNYSDQDKNYLDSLVRKKTK